LPHDIDQIEPLLDRLDGFVIAGGGYQFPVPDLIDPEPAPETIHKVARARFEWALAQAALDRDVPILGICGGFQVLNAVTGGSLIVDLAQSHPSAIAHNQPGSVDEPGHDITIVAGTRLSALSPAARVPVNSFHRQGVVHIGPGIVAAAFADDGLVEAIEVPGKRFALGVQWHPEWTQSPCDPAMIRALVTAAASRP
jgi:putative glutamine amidotransferase